MVTLQERQERLASLHEQAMVLQNAMSERELTDEERTSLDAFINEAERLAPEIEQMQRLEAIGQRIPQPQARVVPAQNVTPQPQRSIEPGNTRYPTAQEKRQNGWKHPGEFYNAVRSASNRSFTDPRLDAERTAL